MQDNNNELEKFFDKVMEIHSKTITNLSKTDNGNLFIKSDKKMISGDKLSKHLTSILKNDKNSIPNQLSSTDGIFYLKNKNNEIELYFFEFKKIDFYERKTRRQELTELIKSIEKKHPDLDEIKNLKKLKKKLKDKTIESLRLKPLETLILLNKILLFEDNYNISPKDITETKKYYYLVSETKPKNDRTDFVNKTRERNLTNKEIKIFDFLYKYDKFPYDNIDGSIQKYNSENDFE